MTVLSVDANRKIKLTGQLPKSVVFRLVQPSPFRQQGVAHGNGSQLLNRAARFYYHLVDIRPRQHRDKLEPFGISTAIFVTPIIVRAAHGGAELYVF